MKFSSYEIFLVARSGSRVSNMELRQVWPNGGRYTDTPGTYGHSLAVKLGQAAGHSQAALPSVRKGGNASYGS